MRVFIESVGLRGPGLNGWTESRPVLAGVAPYVSAPIVVPPSPMLPPNERRRTVQTVKLALAVGMEAFEAAGCAVAETATVFASSGGDGETIHGILSVLASADRGISPTRFHNSVHNAPAGYWSIATQSHAPSCSLCCYDASFAAGLLEATAWATVEQRTIALIAYDVSYPEPLLSVRHITTIFGTALLLSPHLTAASLASVEVEVRPQSGAASVMHSAVFEALRRAAPAARSLPLLAGLARNAAETLVLDYARGLEVSLMLEPVPRRGGDPMAGG